MNLLIFTTLILVVQNFVKLVGEERLAAWLWYLFTLVSRDAKLQKIKQYKKEHFATYKEQQQISAQDQYARWTKLNRKLDQLKKNIDDLTEEVSSQRAKFVAPVKSISYIALKLPIFIVSFWYRSTPVYYLPRGIFPSYISWFLRFPNAPVNSIGITVWCFSVNLLFELITAEIKHFFFKPAPVKPQEQQPQPLTAEQTDSLHLD